MLTFVSIPNKWNLIITVQTWQKKTTNDDK